MEGTSRPDEVPDGKPKPLSLCDEVLVSGFVKVRCTRQDPEISAIRRAHHRNAIVGIKIENPVVALT